jgi:hypothetical protein
VFHFKSKQKTTDEFCQHHCNPLQWDFLSDGKGKWIFNLSVAEQTNAWIGGYHSILQGMRKTKFVFFLDEMIKHRNQITIEKLRAKGANSFQM